MRIKVGLTPEQVTSVVLAEMKEHSRFLESLAAKIKAKKDSRPYEKEDLKRYREVAAAMDVIVGYYSPPANASSSSARRA